MDGWDGETNPKWGLCKRAIDIQHAAGGISQLLGAVQAVKTIFVDAVYMRGHVEDILHLFAF